MIFDGNIDRFNFFLGICSTWNNLQQILQKNGRTCDQFYHFFRLIQRCRTDRNQEIIHFGSLHQCLIGPIVQLLNVLIFAFHGIIPRIRSQPQGM